MGNLLNSVISAGPIVFGLGLVTVIVCGVVHLFAPGPKQKPPMLRYVLVVAGVGFAAFVAGTAMGIAAFCSAADSGNLCGLGGVFGVGPLLSGICMAAYSCFWLRGTRNTA